MFLGSDTQAGSCHINMYSLKKKKKKKRSVSWNYADHNSPCLWRGTCIRRLVLFRKGVGSVDVNWKKNMQYEMWPAWWIGTAAHLLLDKCHSFYLFKWERDVTLQYEVSCTLSTVSKLITNCFDKQYIVSSNLMHNMSWYRLLKCKDWFTAGIVNKESLGFGLLVRQKKQFEDVFSNLRNR